MLGFKLPKDDHKYQWTNHVKDKMVYYRISESLIKRIVRFPKRIEIGIATGTTAVMMPYGSPVKAMAEKRQKAQPYKGELWVMYIEVGKKPTSNAKFLISNFQSKKRIISAWRYPGVSPVGEPIQIPDEILQELDDLLQ